MIFRVNKLIYQRVYNMFWCLDQQNTWDWNWVDGNVPLPAEMNMWERAIQRWPQYYSSKVYSHYLYSLISKLVGGVNHLEKYQSMGRVIPYIMENKKVWNHQPVNQSYQKAWGKMGCYSPPAKVRVVFHPKWRYNQLDPIRIFPNRNQQIQLLYVWFINQIHLELVYD